MLIETLSTFPHMYDSVMGSSMMRIAQEKGIIEFRAYDLRDWTRDRHRTTDDEPYGGGDGLVMKCEPIFEAVESILGGGCGHAQSLEQSCFGEQDGSAVLANGGKVGAADACGTQSSPLFRPLRGTKAAWVEGGAVSGTTDALAHPSATCDFPAEDGGAPRQPLSLEDDVRASMDAEESDCNTSAPGDVEGFDSGAAARDGGGGVPRAVPHDANSPAGCSPKQDRASMACPRPRPARACVVFLAPQGRRFDDALACELAREQRLLFVCGHYEGIDERAYELADEVVSLGDYVLTSGELASMVVIDAVVRKLPGVLGAEAGAQTESFADGLLEYPQYTRPADFRGREVPAVLLSGDHGAVARWRREQSLERTARLRPDLLESAELSEADREFLHTLGFGGDAQGA